MMPLSLSPSFEYLLLPLLLPPGGSSLMETLETENSPSFSLLSFISVVPLADGNLQGCNRECGGGNRRTASATDTAGETCFRVTRCSMTTTFMMPPDFICAAARDNLFMKNAGGQGAILSESLSMELFARDMGACDFVGEMQVEYFFQFKMVDFVCSLGGRRVGVSVTRAMNHIDPLLFDRPAALRLLQKKLSGLVVARNCVSSKHSFDRCFLHVWCQCDHIARVLQSLPIRDVLLELEIDPETMEILLTVDNEPAIYCK